MGFETSVFTDVTAEESVDSFAGFGFQAVSADFDGADRSFTQQSLQHQVSPVWATVQDGGEHPPTSMYLPHEGRYYWSRGQSTGSTNNGRPGNQLTMTAVARNPDDLEPYRPAQLHAATDWNLSKRPGKNCEPWVSPVEISEDFDAESLLTWFREDPWALEVLPSFLTMVEQAAEPAGPKVIIVSDDQDTVMRWFAVATLLVDAVTALSLGYRVFANDPYRTPAQLVGVHPAMATTLGSAKTLINLTDRTFTPVDPSPIAGSITRWVQELDPFDALELVSLARRWTPQLDAELAAAGAEMVTGQRGDTVGRDHWTLSIRVVRDLARNGLRDDLETYAEELSDAVSAYRLSGEEDFIRSAEAARFVVDHGLGHLAGAILDPALESLAGEPEWAGIWARHLTAGNTWRWPQSLDLQHVTVPALVEITGRAPAEAVPALLELLYPLKSLLPPASIDTALQSAEDLLWTAPQRIAESDRWPDGRLIRSRLRVRLLDELAREGTAPGRTFAALCRGDWDALDPRESTASGRAALETDKHEIIPWLAAASVAKYPDEDGRIAAIEATGQQQDPDRWSHALTTMAPSEQPAVFAAWIRNVQVTPELFQQLKFEVLEPALREEPGQPRRQAIQTAVHLAGELSRARFRNPMDQAESNRIFEDLDELQGSMPTKSAAAFNAAASFLKSPFGKRHDDSRREEES